MHRTLPVRAQGLTGRGRGCGCGGCGRRVRYDQTIGDLKDAASRALGVPREHLQLFRHKHELTAAYDDK